VLDIDFLKDNGNTIRKDMKNTSKVLNLVALPPSIYPVLSALIPKL
jgi:hypothetical protein